MNGGEPTKQNLIDKAKEHRIFYKQIDEEEMCEFISCKNNAVLNLDDFHVCIQHGFRLIQCLTEKLNDDTLAQENENESEDS